MNTIDADGHIVEKDADIRKHLSEPHSKRGPLLPSDGMDTGMEGLWEAWSTSTFRPGSKTWTEKGSTFRSSSTSSFAVNSFNRARLCSRLRPALTTTLSPRYPANLPRLKGIALLPFQDLRRRYRSQPRNH